jgi:hypothetical protein
VGLSGNGENFPEETTHRSIVRCTRSDKRYALEMNSISYIIFSSLETVNSSCDEGSSFDEITFIIVTILISGELEAFRVPGPSPFAHICRCSLDELMNIVNIIMARGVTFHLDLS